MILLTRKWRLILAHYCLANGLPRAGSLPNEKGYLLHSYLPFGKAARNVIQRVANNLQARKMITAVENNGTLNTAMQNALLPPPPKETMGQKTLRLALKEVGVHEDPMGSNRGRRVEYYQSSTGAYGLAWCASFCSKMAQDAGYTGSVSAGAWNLTDTCGHHVSGLRAALPGDAVSLNEGEGHVGLLMSVHWSAGTFTMVSGNTNDAVHINDWPISLIHSISRLSN